MDTLYILSLVPAFGVYFFARNMFRHTTRRRRIPASVRARFEPQLFGWGILSSLFWFFLVAFITAFVEPEHITLLLLTPAAFTFGEIIGLWMWRNDVQGFMVPRSF